MDKKLLENFAVEARRKLIESTKTRLALLGITEEGARDRLAQSTHDLYMFDIGLDRPYMISGQDIEDYEELVREMDKRGRQADGTTAYQGLVEEVAYTWFNRLVAIRFMEVNNYLPFRVRVLSSSLEGVAEPEILSRYQDMDIGLTSQDKEELARLEGDQDADGLFQKVFIKVCQAMNPYLPELFEATAGYENILLNISYLDQEGVVYKLVNDIPESYFDVQNGGQVEIIGWLYQYYNQEVKEEVIDIKGKKIVKKEEIPAATQIFTTDWVVRYMVDNSLGKFWLERNPSSSLGASLDYLIPGQIEELDNEIRPEEIRVLDNAMGSGHILVYAFDVLMDIYKERGYSQANAAISIIENNLYGLEIDKRAYQLAYFTIMMKAREYDRRALEKNISHNLAYFEDSYEEEKDYLQYFGWGMKVDDRERAQDQLLYLIDSFSNAKELGSIMVLEKLDHELIEEFLHYRPGQGIDDLSQPSESDIRNFSEKYRKISKIARLLTSKYHIVVTNPPYLNRFSPELKAYIEENYKDYKSDLFAVFIYMNMNMCKENGYSAYMTPNVWMFIVSYEKLRKYIIGNSHIDSLLHIAKGAFYDSATVDVMSFVLKNSKSDLLGRYVRLDEFRGDMDLQKEKVLEAIDNPNLHYIYSFDQQNFAAIPGSPIAYWAGPGVIKAFEEGTLMGDFVSPKQGLATANNNRFLRLWWEPDRNKISLDSMSIEESVQSACKWFPYNKGGERRQWYGNYEYVVNWEDDGEEIRNFKDANGKLRSRPQNTDYYFKEAISWSDITSGRFSIRYKKPGGIHDVTGMSAFSYSHDRLMYALALTSTKVSNHIFDMMNPTIHLQIGDFMNFPVLMLEADKKEEAIKLAEENIGIAEEEWDSYETSWDFKTHPFLLHKGKTIEESFDKYRAHREGQVRSMQAKETQLNETFIVLYQLEDVLDPQVDRGDITLRDADLKEDVKAFISYGVGCMMGRYSLDEEGLVYAGGKWEPCKYKSFQPVEDGILLITGYGHDKDDATARFIDFVKTSYGEETLEENLDFIARALGGKGTAEEVLRDYFIKDFFKDHAKTYSVRGSGKRPIYWEYSSGKKEGFKALVYMHRYGPDTTGQVRTDYLHKVEAGYEKRLKQIENELAFTSQASDQARLERERKDLTDKLAECRAYDSNLAHLANRRIGIDLDDGVKVNHEKIQKNEDGENLGILTKI